MLDFNTSDIRGLFCRLFFPTLLGMFAVSAVTTVDGIFVGRCAGGMGIAAVNLCVPLIMVMTGFGLMVGVGGSVAAAVNLGRGKIIYARALITQSFTAAVIFSAIAAAVLMLAPRTAGRFLGSSDTLLPLVCDYLVYFAPSLIFELILAVGMFALRLDGVPNYAMAATLVTAFLNLVLDYLFMVPLGMSVKGAALATTLSCAAGAMMVIYHLMFKGRVLRLQRLRLSRSGILFFIKCLKVQCILGSSALLGEMTLAVLMMTGNLCFMHYAGDAGVGAFGIACYYLPYVFMIGNAIAQSAQPIISYNLPLKNELRIHAALEISLKTALLLGISAALCFILLPKYLVFAFIVNEDPSYAIASAGFPLIGAAFIAFVVNLAVLGFLQSIEAVKKAVMLALLRGAVLLIPSFIILPKIFGVSGIWAALTFSETLTLIIVLAVWYINSKNRGRQKALSST